MGERTSIGWTDATWNPWHGCKKVSPGCKYCYMYRDKERYGQDPTNVVRSKTKFREPLKWAEPRRVFTCSWSDWFIAEADAWRDEAWDVIRRTPQHTYQVLTKRPERIVDHLPKDWGAGYPNVWLGVSCETQEYADERIPLLLAVPVAVKFLSCEPLLGAIDLHGWINSLIGKTPRVDWVIVGGESGGTRRDMKVEWAQEIADQCAASGIPLFVKQDSAPRDGQQGRIPDELWARKDFPVSGEPLGTEGAP